MIDWFIPDHSSELTLDQLVRFRTVVCAMIALSTVHIVYSVALGVGGQTGYLAVVNLSLALLFGLGPVLTRLTRSLLFASTWVCVLPLATLTFVALHQDGYYWIASAWIAIIPVLSMYFMGTRGGTIMSILVVAITGLVVYCHRVGWVFPDALVPAEGSVGWVLHNFGAIGCLMVSAYFHTLSRERTLQHLAESQGKLLAVVQSSSDPIFAVDANTCLTTFNPPFSKLIEKSFGRLPQIDMELGEFIPEHHLEEWTLRAKGVLDGKEVRFEQSYQGLEDNFYLEVSVSPILSKGEYIGFTCIGRDISQRKHNEKLLAQSNSKLIALSREAGMSDVATGILHNVGNVLNSVNLSVGAISDKLGDLRIDRLQASASMLSERATQSDALSTDEKLKLVPRFLVGLGEHQAQTQELLGGEVEMLASNIDHIKSIISMQQSLVKASVVVEKLALQEVVEAAIEVSTLERSGFPIEVERDFADLEPFVLNRHKVLQILINLLSNARHALRDSDTAEGKVTVRIRRKTPQCARVEIVDNGVGIPSEIRDQLFVQGFTTKTDGNGYGLHTSALVAQEIDAALKFESDGLGTGATFILELPICGDGEPG